MVCPLHFRTGPSIRRETHCSYSLTGLHLLDGHGGGFERMESDLFEICSVWAQITAIVHCGVECTFKNPTL